MSSAATSPETKGGRGYLVLMRGQGWDGYSHANYGPLFDYRQLPRRVGDAGTILFMYLQDRTRSAYGSPEWADITLSELCRYANKSDRAIRLILKSLEAARIIERDPKDPWRFKTCPENIAAAPVRTLIKHPNAAAKKRCAGRTQVSAPRSIAALKSESRFKTLASAMPGAEAASSQEVPELPPAGCPSNTVLKKTSEADFSGSVVPENVRPLTEPVDQPTGLKHNAGAHEALELKPVSNTVNSAEATQPISGECETSVLAAETQCPLEWACPFLSSEIAGHKPLTQVTLKLEASRSAPPADDDRDRQATSDELDQIRRLLLEELSDRCPGDEPSRVLCQRIYVAMQGAPLEWATKNSGGTSVLRYRIRTRYTSIESYGFVECLAQDIGKRYREFQVNAREQQRERHDQVARRLVGDVVSSFRDLHGSWQALTDLVSTGARNIL